MKTRRLGDEMAHLTLSPYFLDTVRHLTLYIVLPPFLNASIYICMWFMVKSLQRLIFRNGGSTCIVLTVIYQRDSTML